MASNSHVDSTSPSVPYRIISSFGSLKITVVLFVMAIFIVFAGTLAQTEKDIWQVVHDYFRMDLSSPESALRTAMAWIDVRIFFPPSFFQHLDTSNWKLGFWFPNGWLIGLCLMINLSAAHALRFRVQATGGQLTAGIVVIAVGIIVTLGIIFAGSGNTADRIKLFVDWPSLRILWLLLKCSFGSLILLGGCAMVFHKRAGIVLLHAGVGLLMFGELLVGVAAVEGQMHIVEGQTVDYAMDTRHLEVAVTDTSDADVDHLVAIPLKLLISDTTARHEDLPFDVELVQHMANSTLSAVQPGELNPANAGAGQSEIAQETPPIGGTDRSGKMNHPAAYVRIYSPTKDALDATYLLTLDRWMSGRVETLEVDGRRFEISLRYVHLYKPYSLNLIDVRQDHYMGTQKAKSYSSEIRLVDPSHNVDRRVRIWMNNPLRYGGDTLYQSNYGQDAASRREYTGLQVVTNLGWRIPYMACVVVSWGMLAQFWLVLTRFLKRRRSTEQPQSTDEPMVVAQKAPSHETTGRRFSSGWGFAALVLLVCVGWLSSKAVIRPPADGKTDLAAFGRLPVMYEGRVKPFDTLARNTLRIVSDRQTYRDDDEETQPAIRWLLDVITDSEAASGHRVFRIHNLDVLETLGLEPRKGFRYAIDEFHDKIDEFDEQVKRARETPTEQLDLYGKKILELNRKLNQYSQIREAFRLPQLRKEHLSEDLAYERSRRMQLSGLSLPLAIPPFKSAASDVSTDDEASPDASERAGKTGSEIDGETEVEPWQAYTHALFDAMAQGMLGRESNPATVALAKVFADYEKGNSPREFNRNVKDYRELLEERAPAEWRQKKTDFEAFFNHFAPIYYAMILYFIAFLLACFSWLGWSRPLNRAAFCLIVFTLIVHTFGLIARMYISGRPPVTNLYTSAVFLGWGGVLLGLVAERFTKIGIGNVVAAASGFAALLVGFLLTTTVPSFKGDTFTVLVAVLDTQFWLAIHVTSITLGYSATFIAGNLGIIYILLGVLTPSLSEQVRNVIARMIYGIICFALFFSFVGTVLGGLWADDAWGRFWGWDPKENGALIIVLWNAVVIHALWGRMVKDRGLAVLAIIGNIVTAWSWFGVNELGVGLHTYGFTEGVKLVLGLFVLSQIVIIVLGLLPKSWWRSYRHSTP